MSLEVSFERVDLPTERPFRISRSTMETRPLAIVEVSDDAERTGIGSASPSAYYGESIDSVTEILPELASAVEDVGDPFAVGTIHERMVAATEGEHPAARAGVDIAVHDLVARRTGVPLYRYLGFGGEYSLPTSYTIGIDEPAAMAEHAREAVEAGFAVLKVKLGTDDDAAIIERIREVAPEVRIRVDANGAWDPDDALSIIDVLADHDVEFVEQPVPADDPDGLAYVHERSPLPIAADESSRDADSIPAVADRCDIVTVKLMKTGGVRGAIEQIHAARAHGCDVMLGCMLETDASIAAAAHLVPYASYADLDGSILLAEDPYDGAPIEDGVIRLRPSLSPGTGAE